MVTHPPKPPMDTAPKPASPESNAMLSDSHGNHVRYRSERAAGWTVGNGVLGCKSVHGTMELPLKIAGSTRWDNAALMNLINGSLRQVLSRQQIVRAEDELRPEHHRVAPGGLRNEERSASGIYTITSMVLKPDATRTLQEACRAAFEGRGFYYQDGVGHISPPPVKTSGDRTPVMNGL